MADTANVILTLPSRPENVLVVRQALTGLAEGLGLDPVDTNDLNTAVTEACNNVVLHAYPGPQPAGEEPGQDEPLEVEVTVLAQEIAVVVRDRGTGMRPSERLEEEEQHGMGLAVIAALTREVEFADVAGGGTEVRMRFARAKPGRPLEVETDAAGAANGADAALAQLPGSVQLQLAPGALARAVLPRTLCALAARAYFTVDRISDVQLIAAAIAENAPSSVDGTHLGVGVNVEPRALALRIGPLHSGRGESVLSAAVDGLAPVVKRLTDLKRITPLGDGESLELALVDRR